jgi:hypothetical protein
MGIVRRRGSAVRGARRGVTTTARHAGGGGRGSSCGSAAHIILLLLHADRAAAADADPVLPQGCSGSFKGNYVDGGGSYGAAKRVLSVGTPCNGACPNPNPKACPQCTADGKDWCILDSKIDCPKTQNACPGCPSKFTPDTCMGSCSLFGSFRYAGVEDGNQCFCGDKLPSKKADPKAQLSPCKGDASKKCGGGNIVGVYEIRCKHGHGAEAELSGGAWGWISAAGILGTALGYVVVGTAYNYGLRGQRSRGWKGALPHPEFWGQLHGLVRDGLAFSMIALRLKKKGTPGETLKNPTAAEPAALQPSPTRKKRRTTPFSLFAVSFAAGPAWCTD